jgi:nucleoside-diphosphate-sugar epimerase
MVWIFVVYVFQVSYQLIQNQVVVQQVCLDFKLLYFDLLHFSDYAIEIFHDALKSGAYKCYLRDDTRLPMMWIDDCIQSIVSIMEATDDQLKQRTYNVAAMSFTPQELTKAIQKYKPNFKISYQIDDRQKIGKNDFI